MKKESYVYLMYAKKSNQYKIGVSNDVEARRRTLEGSSGLSIEVVAFYKTKDNAYKVEARLHKLFDKYRTLGEWFEFPDSYSLMKFETICDKHGMTPMCLSLLFKEPEEQKTIYEKIQEYKPEFKSAKVELKQTVYPDHIMQLYRDGKYQEYGQAVLDYRMSGNDF